MECSGCGKSAVVPPALARAAGLERSSRGPVQYDFDQEIVTAARSRPLRRVKTPGEVREPSSEFVPDLPSPASPIPRFDLLRVRRAPAVLIALSWLVMVAAVVGMSLFIAIVEPTWLRVIGAATIAVIGFAVHAGLGMLAEACRLLVGLAERQREIASQVEQQGR